MENKLYKLVGVFLLLEGLGTMILYFMANLSFAYFFTGKFSFIPILIMLFGLYYLYIGFMNRPSNRVIFASVLIQAIGLVSLVSAFLFGVLPCILYPRDGLCFLWGVPFLLLVPVILVGVCVVLVIGIIMQKVNKTKSK